MKRTGRCSRRSSARNGTIEGMRAQLLVFRLVGFAARCTFFNVERCGGRMKILAAIRPPDGTTRILECLGLPSNAPPVAAAVSDFTTQIDSA